MRYQRRKLRVGHVVVEGVVCTKCPDHPVLYPQSIVPKHNEIYHRGVNFAEEKHRAFYSRGRGGRPPGSKNKNGTMSATGIEKNVCVKNQYAKFD